MTPTTAHRHPLPLGATIGILGGGQLARMLALAAAKLGLNVHVYSDIKDPPAAAVSHAVTVAPYDDTAQLARFAQSVDVITYEFENVPVHAAKHLQTFHPVRPRPQALAVAQDRLAEKQFMHALGIPLAPFAAVESQTDLAAALKITGLPAILKTRRMGYDGKGQARLKTNADAADALDRIGGGPAILEGFIPFAREISLIAVRGQAPDGTMQQTFYDCPENTHRDGILHTSHVPASVSPAQTTQAHTIASLILEELDYIGVLAVEFFHLEAAIETPAGPLPAGLVVNEIAPRVHNSGHWTMDACTVDQFENHIRAVAGWPLGTTERHSDVTMTNLIGPEIHQWSQLLEPADNTVSLHVYGKTEARDGRKMGHFNTIRPKTRGK